MKTRYSKQMEGSISTNWLVIVDFIYPFEKNCCFWSHLVDSIEIDIGARSTYPTAAKNFKDTVIVSSVDDYSLLR
jgi:phosphoribosylaminoimidazolecarboxamide formyltransferase/IMP cyclohydrolase